MPALPQTPKAMDDLHRARQALGSKPMKAAPPCSLLDSAWLDRDAALCSMAGLCRARNVLGELGLGICTCFCQG